MLGSCSVNIPANSHRAIIIIASHYPHHSHDDGGGGDDYYYHYDPPLLKKLLVTLIPDFGAWRKGVRGLLNSVITAQITGSG